MSRYARDVQTIMETSGYVSHGGVTRLGGSYRTCICPKTACGGVAGGSEDADCPEHSLNPLQWLHWAAECPAQTCAECGGRYVPARPGATLPGYLVHAEECSQF